MSAPAEVPDPDLIYDLYTGIYKLQLFRIALLLDIFSPLAQGPANAAHVARTCGSDEAGIRALLEYLVNLGLLESQANQFALTSTALAFLVPGRKSYTGDLVLGMTDPLQWEAVLQAFRTGQPSRFAENWVQDAWLESYSPWRPARSLEMWRAAGIEPQEITRLRLLDLACGCAIKSFALAQLNPAVLVTCLDSADVLEVARDLAERMQIISQVTFQPGDLLQDDLGQSRYDAVLLGQISYYLTPEQNLDLFARIYRCLNTGGTFLIDALMSEESPGEQASLYTAILWASSGGAAHSFERYRSWLAKVGFTRITQLSERWLSAAR